MLDETLPVTLQYQLAAELLEQINNGAWQPGNMIPSERELCERYSVSRMTVREVLKKLVQEGYLIRKQGKGTFVTFPKLQQTLVSTYSFSQELQERDLGSEFRILEFSRQPSDSFLQQRLEIKPGEDVFKIVRLRLIDGERFAWEKACVPCSVMEGATDEQLNEYGLYITILRCSGLVAEEAEEEIEAVNCPEAIADTLLLPKKTAVIHLIRLTKAQYGRHIEYCESYIHGEKYQYRHVLKKKTI